MNSRPEPEGIRHRIEMSFAPSSSCSPHRDCPTMSLPRGWIPHGRSSASGASASSSNASPASMRSCERGRTARFSPRRAVEPEVKRTRSVSFPPMPGCRSRGGRSRSCGAKWCARGLDRQDQRDHAVALVGCRCDPAVAPSQLALSPGPAICRTCRPHLGSLRGPLERPPVGAARLRDLGDEKTSIQARQRRHAPAPVAPGRERRVEHEYTRRGAWAYLASLGCPPRSALRAVRAAQWLRPV